MADDIRGRVEDDICSVRTIEDVRAMKKAHKGGTWKYACACRSGVRYEGEGEAWRSLKAMIDEKKGGAQPGSAAAAAMAKESERDLFGDGDGVEVAPEDRGPGALRGAGARSPLFWKIMLVSMALIWGYSFLTMKTVLDTIPTFTLLASRFLPSAAIMFVLFHKRIRAHLNFEYVGLGFMMGCVIWSAYGAQTLGLVDTTPGKNAFLTGTYCILVPFIAFILFRERITKWHVSSAVLCLSLIHI